uniref:Transmembrane protein n=1 Tax=Caenorhabditis tropicalis TaxID=1561998 RepID=A0A1I7U8G8_9PELO
MFRLNLSLDSSTRSTSSLPHLQWLLSVSEVDTFLDFEHQKILFQVTILSIFPGFLSSLIATIWMIAFLRWLGLHGKKMTRNEVIYFEVSNMLEVDPPVFRFGLPENGDDCLTPGDGEQREAPQPQTLWDALFTDEKKIQMDKFYRRHYGGVHAHASKMLSEYEMEQAKEKEKSSKISNPEKR